MLIEKWLTTFGKYLILMGRSVAAEYPYCLQSEQLFQNVTVLAEIHHSVQLDVVTGSCQYSMLDDELFRGDDVSEFVET